MRACGGVWVAHGSGDADRGDRGRARPARACPPDDPRYTLRRVWLTQGGGGGLLLRLLQRGAVAALPHRAHAPAVPARRLGALPRGEREVRRRRAGGDRGRRVADGPHPGLSLRAAARRSSSASARTRASAIFWHIPWPNFEAFGICPWQRRAPARHARRRPHRLPHPVLLQQLPRDGRPRASRRRSTGSASR